MSNYVDITAIMQVIGCVFNSPQLLDQTDKYSIVDEDFPNDFHRVIFGAIYKIHELGAKEVTLESVSDFLATRPKSYAIYKQKGDEWLIKVAEAANLSTFDYYYSRLKKFSLLRAYHSYGVDIKDIYDIDNIIDMKKKQLQEEYLDNSTLEQIAAKVEERIENIRAKYVEDAVFDSHQAGDGIFELIDRLKEYPEAGVPLYGTLMNTVTRGARLKKFYLRSAPSGYGKSRTMVADVCNIGANRIYDETFGWIKNGTAEPVVYITTEQEIDEIQTMMLAFLSNVNEERILNGHYIGDEEQRVMMAAQILEKSPIYIEVLLDFSIQDVEDRIKRNIRDHDVKYVFFDYIQTSPKILEEISRKSGGVRLREDNILFMLSAKMKDMANQYGVFVMSATQVNGEWKEADIPDQNLLRGAKSIADRIDLGEIQLPAREKDIAALESVLSSGNFPNPNFKLSFYKNRRGKYKGIYLWATGDLGTCRLRPMFATTWDYELIPMEDLKILIEENKSAF